MTGVQTCALPIYSGGTGLTVEDRDELGARQALRRREGVGGSALDDAVVSAVSKAVTEQEVLSIVFVLEWGGE